MSKYDVQDLISDVGFVKYVINRCIPFPTILKLLDGYDDVGYDHNIFCCFHSSGHNTTNARLYKNNDGDTMFCYVCRKVYRPSDVITRELVNTRLESVFYRLWKQLPEAQQDALIDAYNNKLDIVSSSFLEHVDELEKFKKGEIDVTELRELLIRYV